MHFLPFSSSAASLLKRAYGLTLSLFGVIALSLIPASSALSQAKPAYTLIGLGSLGTYRGNPSDSQAAGINNSGQIAGSSALYNGNTYQGRAAFLYSNGTLTDLGSLGVGSDGSRASTAAAINDKGQVVGSSAIYDAGGTFHGTGGFLYSGGAMVNVGSLGTDRSGSGLTEATGINMAGQVVGDSELFDQGGSVVGQAIFLYSGGALTNLSSSMRDSMGRAVTQDAVINDAGQVAGNSLYHDWSGDFDGYTAFLYGNGVLTDVGNFGVSSSGYRMSKAAAINRSGQVAGTSSTYDGGGVYQGQAAFLSSGGALTNLGQLYHGTAGLGDSFASGLNSAGQVVGTYGYETVGTVYISQYYFLGGFLFSGGTLYDLAGLVSNDPGWAALKPVGINDAGQIAGTGSYYGRTEAFLLTPLAPALASLAVPSPVPGGTVLNATITLNGVSTSDTVVGLSSSDPTVVRVFQSVLVPAGSQSATFAINTFRSHTTKTVTIQATQATQGRTVQMASLTISGR